MAVSGTRSQRGGSRNQNLAPKPQGIMVLGMHRSGTSAVMRTLNLLGCALPDELIGGGDGNELGHWESLATVLLNDRILSSAGSSWEDWGPINPDWRESGIRSTMVEQIGEVVKAHAALGPLFGLKDPRLCRLADLWLEGMDAAGVEPCVIIMIRNPLEVAASLENRDLMAFAYGQLLWLRHVLDAEFFSRGRRRVVFRYDQLMRNWHGMIQRVRSGLGVALPRNSPAVHAEIDQFLSSQHRHHEMDVTAVSDDSSLPSWLRRSFAILYEWSELGEENQADHAELDRIRQEFDNAYAAFSRVLLAAGVAGDLGSGSRLKRELNEQLNVAREAADEAQSKINEAEARQADLSVQLEANEARAEQLQAEIEQERAHRLASEQHLANALAETQKKSLQISELEGKASAFESALVQRQEELAQYLDRLLASEKAASAAEVLEKDVERYSDEILELTKILQEKEKLVMEAELARSEAHQDLKRRDEERSAMQARLQEQSVLIQATETARVATEQKLAVRSDEIARLTAMLADESSRASVSAANAEWLRQITQLNEGFPKWWALLPARLRSKREHARYRQTGLFDAEAYQESYPDVAAHGMDPVRHYVLHGMSEGRQPSGCGNPGTSQIPLAAPGQTSRLSDAPSDPALDPVVESTDMRLIERVRSALSSGLLAKKDGVYELVAQHFDKDYYLLAYPDVADAGVDPVQHYLENGWKEDRDPSLAFSTRFYVENNPDIVAAGVNPFFHFIAAGKSEGRAGKHNLGFRWDTLSKLKSVSEQIRELKSSRASTPLGNPDKLLSALRSAVPVANRIVLSFSHDDFTQHLGGIQLVLRRELALLRERGDAQVHLFPSHSLPFLDTSGESISLGVLVNGTMVGHFPAPEVARCLRDAALPTGRSRFLVHSLLGHNMDQTIDLILAAGMSEGCLWIHDYSPLYNNFKLLRNDVEYRGFPRVGTLARELCEFARADFDHAIEFKKLFGKFKIKLISPSQVALDIWNDAGVLKPVTSEVVEHIRLEKVSDDIADVIDVEAPLRVGYLGFPVTHKGWEVFQDIVLRFGDDPRYEFHHLGKGRRGGIALKYTEVVANETRMEAMREAVSAARIDVAILWSIWPETFCLTAYEALAGGAAVVTNPDAGNVAAVTEQTGLGVVIPDQAALIAAFESGALLHLSRSQRQASYHTMHYSALSLEVLD